MRKLLPAAAKILLLVLAVRGSVAAVCTPAPSDMISWYQMEGTADDELGANDPSATSGVSFVTGEVGLGVALASGGFIDIPHSASLAIQQITLDAWVRPDGPGPNNDGFGSVIILKSIDGSNVSYSLAWSAVTNRFGFYFGSIGSEQINSANTFPTGAFYHVAGTYDGATFRLYVNGALEGSFSLAKTITYTPSIEWSIGSAPAFARGSGFSRTWNGVIDEVEIIDRALSLSEIADLYNAGSDGKCPFPTPTPTTSPTPTDTPPPTDTPTATPADTATASPTATAGGGCAATPLAGCHPPEPGKSLLLLKNSSDDTRDKLTWKWLSSGAAVTLDALGDPTTTTGYTVCLYAGNAAASVAIPAGSSWELAGTTGFRFKDSTGSPNGAQKAKVKLGPGDRPKALVKGRGMNLPDALVPPLPLPVIVQMVNTANNVCFSAFYDADGLIKNDTKQFKGKVTVPLALP